MFESILCQSKTEKIMSTQCVTCVSILVYHWKILLLHQSYYYHFVLGMSLQMIHSFIHYRVNTTSFGLSWTQLKTEIKYQYFFLSWVYFNFKIMSQTYPLQHSRSQTLLADIFNENSLENPNIKLFPTV